MTVTASTLLSLPLITTGTESGAWGNLVNNGLTSYLDNAIAGTVTLTNDGAVTLSNTAGTDTVTNIVSSLTGAGSVSSQFAIIRVTGTLTTAKVLTAPSLSKTFVVVNAATGSTVTIKASGQTGISVAVGETATVYFNGTDYVKSATTLSGTGTVTSVAASVPAFLSIAGSPITTSGTLAITYSGTALPIANGGTSATTAPAANAALQTYTTTATAAGTTTLTNASTYYQYFTGSTTQTIQMPVTSTLSLGWSFHIANNSTGNLTVNSSGANAIGTILPGTTMHITCIGTALTTAADWDYGITDFGSVTGTGANVLATAPTLTNPTVTNYVETPYTATISAGAITLDLTNGTVQFITFGAASATITMPTAVSGKSFTLFLKQDSVGSRAATWTTVSWPSATAPTLTTTANKLDKFVFTSNGTSWFGSTAGQNYT